MSLYIAYPLVFFEESIQEYDRCIVHSSLWSEWTNNIADVLIVKITQGEKVNYLHVHSHHSISEDVIYIPTWCIGSVTTAEVTMELVTEMPPEATKITLQPLDNEVYHCDIAGAVSAHLSNWQVLTEGTTLTVTCDELGGFPVDIFVKSIEPEKTVLLRGEVPLELEEPIETIEEWIHSTSPNQAVPAFVDGPLLPEPTQPTNNEIHQKKFTPFGGKGYSLL
jgi:hypothetical protein